MNFITFPVGSTNLFPAVNSTTGSQLLTEWNIRSRETIATDSKIKYETGPSYTHSIDDFDVHVLKDDAGNLLNSYTLEIGEGRALINGHYVETLAPMIVDLVQANIELQNQAMPPLTGALTIGFRAFYATEESVATTLLVENKDDMFLGIQTVVLPSGEFVTPEESPTDSSKVTAHLRLATFQYNNGKISSIKNSKTKIQFIQSNRLLNASSLVDSSYIRKTGLNAKKLYGFAGKGTDPSSGLDTWEDITDSTIIWDVNPQRTTMKPVVKEAQFAVDDTRVYLNLPHKQVEGMVTESGDPEYYATKALLLPVADYGENTPGVVNSAYTSQIKMINNKVEEFRTTLHGKQIRYLEVKTSDMVLPTINASWSIGDYILVGTDYSADDSTDGIRPPSTMYVVLPGVVQSIVFFTKIEGSDEIPEGLTGVQLGLLNWSEKERYSPPNTTDPEQYPVFYIDGDNIRGVPGVDYFRLRYVYNDDSFENYYYKVETSGPREFSNAVLVTGEIPFAQEDSIGGFLNVSPTNTDYGYVYRDDYGRLRLIDYGLLRSGTLAYQLAEDLVFPSGVTTEEVQNLINEYVNDRVAFPNSTQLQSSSPNCIHLYMHLVQEEEPTTVTIGDIDSRFNTSVCLHISGDANSNTVINISDCQKFRIDNVIEGTPIINVYRTTLYYDPAVFDYIRTCDRGDNSDFTGISNIKLWYEAFEETDPNLLVDNMTVSEIGAPVVPDSISYWANIGSEVNDNYYLVALNSITFSGNGDIVKCALLIANQSTDNIVPGDKIVVADFELPQGSGLLYPKSCLTHQMKVTGSFVSAYLSGEDWYTTNTLFSALTQVYDPYSADSTIKGNIAFHSTTTTIPTTIQQTSIPAWETDTYHLFYGGILN